MPKSIKVSKPKLQKNIFDRSNVGSAAKGKMSSELCWAPIPEQNTPFTKEGFQHLNNQIQISTGEWVVIPLYGLCLKVVVEPETEEAVLTDDGAGNVTLSLQPINEAEVRFPYEVCLLSGEPYLSVQFMLKLLQVGENRFLISYRTLVRYNISRQTKGSIEEYLAEIRQKDKDWREGKKSPQKLSKNLEKSIKDIAEKMEWTAKKDEALKETEKEGVSKPRPSDEILVKAIERLTLVLEKLESRIHQPPREKPDETSIAPYLEIEEFLQLAGSVPKEAFDEDCWHHD